jgi:hypothetical protein
VVVSTVTCDHLPRENNKNMRSIFLIGALICGFSICAAAQDQVKKIILTDDKVGSEPTTFLSMVGDWTVVQDAGKKVLSVDGQRWLNGQPSRGLAEKARGLRFALRSVHGQRQGVRLLPVRRGQGR